MSRGLNVKKAEAALKRAAHRALRGTREERSGRVLSSVLTDITYDADHRYLDVRFVTGRRYRYLGVSPEVFERLMSAESKGKFFNAHIRDQYEYQERPD